LSPIAKPNKKDMATRNEMFTDEKVFLKYIPNYGNGISDKTHPEYGGLSNNARVGISAPVLTRRINEIFSKDELGVLAIELNDPTLVHNDSRFWKEYVTDEHGMSSSIFPIFLKKEGAMYNKKNPIDYIYIRVLEDSNSVGNSIDDAKANGCKFAMIREKDQFKKEKTDISLEKQAMKLYLQYEEDEEILRYLLSSNKKQVSISSNMDHLQNEAWKEKTSNTRTFIGLLSDEFLKEKVAMSNFLRYKLINRVNKLYYFEDGRMISLDSELNDDNGTSRYFASGIGQEDFLALKAKLEIMKK
jgi:hypothetical protein